MQYNEKLKAFKSILLSDYGMIEAHAENVVRHVDNLFQQELERTEAVLGAFEGHMQLHPFVYAALAVIAGSALTIAAVFVAKF